MESGKPVELNFKGLEMQKEKYTKKLFYTINIRVNFVFGSLLEQHHPSNLIVLEVNAKR